MTSFKSIGMDVHTESTSIAVRNSLGKIVMECVIETKARSGPCFTRASLRIQPYALSDNRRKPLGYESPIGPCVATHRVDND